MGMTSAAKRVTVIGVSFNSTEVLRQMLGSVPQDVAKVIIDNSPQKSPELVALAQDSGAHLIVNAANNGFGAACNQGADWANSEFLFFVNPDAVIEEDTIEQLVMAADKHPGASAFLPRVAGLSGKPDIKRRSNLMARARYMARGWPEDGAEVTVASGAALMVRADMFARVGGFDPKIFLYHEDDDLTLRLIRDCGPIIFVGDAHVRHIGGAGTVRSPAVARLKAWHMGRSYVYAMRKHGQPMAFVRALLQAVLQILLPLNWLSARKRAKQIGLLKGVLSTLQDGGAGFKEVE